MNTLNIISGGMSGKSVEIQTLTTLGRGPGNTLVFKGVDGRMVSSEHAEISVENDSLLLMDKNSTNGTYLNGERIDKQILKHNDIINLGFNGPRMRVLLKNSEQSRATLQSQQTGPVPSGPAASAGNPGNYTIDLSSRLGSEDVNAGEISNLIKNRGRLSRVEALGRVPQKVLHTLKSAGQVYRQSRKKSLRITLGISIAAACVIIALFIQNKGYRIKLDQQSKLLAEINSMNRRLQTRGGESLMTDSDRLALVGRLRAQERLLLKLRKKIAVKDLQDLYNDPLAVKIHKAMEEFGEHDYVVPDVFVGQVRKYINSWKRGGTFVKKGIQNKKLHGNLILRELERANMPAAFLYLAMHESSLDSVIVSRAGARGIWQFMPATGRKYGLEVPVNWRELPVKADGRTRPLESTHAAIKYLKDLVADFGTIPLAMASYNAGEGRIRRELRKIPDPINHRDFWYIYRSGSLAEETNEYIPKIVATMLIDKNPGIYGY